MTKERHSILTVKFTGKSKQAVYQQYVNWKGIDDRIQIISKDYIASPKVRRHSPTILKKISSDKIPATLTVTYRRGR